MRYPSSTLSRNPRRRGFTLAELLAVIIIMSILMVVVVPSITGMTRGASLRGATMQVRTTLFAARQAAIAQRANVSVLFPSPPALVSTNAKNFRAIAICVATSTPPSVATWDYLPPGIVFQTVNFGVADTATVTVDGTLSTVAALTFNWLGERTTPGTAQIMLMEGVALSGAIQTKAKGGTNQVSVLFPAGIIQVKRL